MSNNYEWPIDLEYKVIEHDKYGLREKHMILGRGDVTRFGARTTCSL